MTRTLTTIRRTVLSTLAAIVLATAFSQAGFAQDTTAAGVWKVDPAKSSFGSGSATLTLERTGTANSAVGSFIVVSKGNVYRVTGAAASAGYSVKPAAYSLTTGGQAVLIGTKARSADHCSLLCQSGLSDRRMTLTFKAVDASGQQISDMLALNGQNQ
jgi:hypothetical protein